MEEWEKPTAKLGAGAVIVQDQQILLVQLNYGPNRGKWTLPGGKVEKEEWLAEAVVREVKEETNLDVEVGDLLAFRQRILPGRTVDMYFLFETKACTRIEGSQLKWPEDELQAVKLWDIEMALSDPNVRPITKEAIRMLMHKSKHVFRRLSYAEVDEAKTDEVYAGF